MLQTQEPRAKAPPVGAPSHPPDQSSALMPPALATALERQSPCISPCDTLDLAVSQDKLLLAKPWPPTPARWLSPTEQGWAGRGVGSTLP